MYITNIAILVLIVDMDLFNTSDPIKIGNLSLFNGDFRDFDSNWFAIVGEILTVNLLIGIVSPHGSYFFFVAMKSF